ncbi:hypothetical protein D3C87_1381100 [compost metagenome]
MDAVADLEIDVLGGTFGVDPFVGVEFCGDGGEDACPARVRHEELQGSRAVGGFRYIVNIFNSLLKRMGVYQRLAFRPKFRWLS